MALEKSKKKVSLYRAAGATAQQAKKKIGDLTSHRFIKENIDKKLKRQDAMLANLLISTTYATKTKESIGYKDKILDRIASLNKLDHDANDIRLKDEILQLEKLIKDAEQKNKQLSSSKFEELQAVRGGYF